MKPPAHDPRRWELTWAHDLRHEGLALPFGRWLRGALTGKAPGWVLHNDQGHIAAVHVGPFCRHNDTHIALGWANGAVAAYTGSGDVLMEWTEQNGFAPWIGRRWIGRSSRIADVVDSEVGPMARRLALTWTAWIDEIAPTQAGQVSILRFGSADTYTVLAPMIDDAAARAVEAGLDALARRGGCPVRIDRCQELIQIVVLAPTVALLLAQEQDPVTRAAAFAAGDVSLHVTSDPAVLPRQRHLALAGGAR